MMRSGVVLLALLAATAAGQEEVAGHDVWTVVHKKRKPRLAVAARGATPRAAVLGEAEALLAVIQRDLGPDDKEAKTTKQKIWEMGKDLCKDRPDHPDCQRFKDQEAAEEEEKEEQVEEQKAEEQQDLQAEKQAAVAPAPAPAPAEHAAVPAPAPTEQAVVPASEVGPAPVTAPQKRPSRDFKPRKLPEQGFHGEGVAYRNGHNINADWRDEYGTLPTDAEFKLQKQRKREARERKAKEEKTAEAEAERSRAVNRLAGQPPLLAVALVLAVALGA